MATKKNHKTKRLGLKTVLQVIAGAVAISVFLKAIIDVDYAFDTWGYHLPFAARIWQIVPAEQYINMEGRFNGFPLFAEFLQGFFWWVTGHVGAANLVGWLSIAVFVYFLKAYFQVPWFLSTIALLAIPLVQTHATSAYVDLPGNIALAITIMMAYVVYKEREFPDTKSLVIIVLSAAAASNTKPQLQPLVFVVLFFIAVRIIWFRWRDRKRQNLGKWLVKAGAIALLSSLLIFVTPIKNIALYGNPFYPVRIEIAGRVLNHTLPLYDASPGYLADAPRAQRWVYSILDIKAAPWSIDQYSQDVDRNRMGGFFGVYVVFHLLLFGYLLIFHRDRQTTIGAAVLLVMSIVAANFPQSHELRYFMYWMLCLVGINLYLVSRIENSSRSAKLVNPKTIGLVSLFALAIVVVKTNFTFIKPEFFTLTKFIDGFKEHPEYRQTLAAIEPNDKVCLVGQYPYTFTYQSLFHPEIDYTYSIEAEGSPEHCMSDRKIIAPDLSFLE